MLGGSRVTIGTGGEYMVMVVEVAVGVGVGSGGAGSLGVASRCCASVRGPSRCCACVCGPSRCCAPVRERGVLFGLQLLCTTVFLSSTSSASSVLSASTAKGLLFRMTH